MFLYNMKLKYRIFSKQVFTESFRYQKTIIYITDSKFFAGKSSSTLGVYRLSRSKGILWSLLNKARAVFIWLEYKEFLFLERKKYITKTVKGLPSICISPKETNIRMNNRLQRKK